MAMLLNEIRRTLRAHGIPVSEGADEATVKKLLYSALARPPAPNGRDLRDLRGVEKRQAALVELLKQLHDETQFVNANASGSIAWEARRRRAELSTAIQAAEDALVAELREAFAGCVQFGDVRESRPHGARLVEFSRELREQDARGELPMPGMSRDITSRQGARDFV